MRKGWMTGLAGAVALATACGSGAPRQKPDPDVGLKNPNAACSELEDATRTWFEESCEPGPELRELLPIGDGYVVDWTPRTKVSRVWAIGAGLPLGEGPVAGGPSPTLSPRTVFVPIGKRRLMMVQTDKTNVDLFTVNVATNPGGDILMATLGEGTFEEGFAGHGIVGLDDDYFLDYRTGTGTYKVGHVDEAASRTNKVLAPTEFHGVNEALRRGARVVNLGQHRLLTWVPHTGRYRIWSYAVEPGREDIFDPGAPVEGTLPADITPNHELLVVAPDRIAVWERNTGRVLLRALDPLSDEPLAGPVVGDRVYPLLRSPDWTAPVKSSIQNVVVVLQQGHSFDAYYGRYCQAAPGSEPTCQEGPGCCEAMPASIPGADACTPLDPAAGGDVPAHVPKDDFACLTTKVQGAPAAFVTPPCGAPADFACTPTGEAAGATGFYHRAAATGSLADRYFQSTLDGIEQNLIYLSKTAFGSSLFAEFGLQITRILAEHNVRWGLYLADADDTRNHFPPIFFDHHWDFFRGVSEIARDVELEQLPAISIIITGDAQSERPGAGPAQVGVGFAQNIVETIAGSARYAPTTLVLVAHVTSGGYFDHVVPPPAPPSEVDTRAGERVAYGPRVPLLALGRFARANHVSHVPLELSSITKFMEWNWRDGLTGEIGHRDAIVSNLGSLLDAAATGTPVPEQ